MLLPRRRLFLWNRISSWVNTDRITAAFTVVLAVATLALVITALIQHNDAVDAVHETERVAAAAENQLIVMGGQLKEMQTTHRAWVNADIVGEGQIFRDETDFFFPLKFILHNSGSLPASIVYPAIEGRSYTVEVIPGPDVINDQKGVCSTAVRNFPETNGPGGAVLPGQSRELIYNGHIKIKEWKNIDQQNGPAHTTLLGCVLYDNGINGIGTTGIVFDIDQVDAGFPNGRGLPPNPVGVKLHVSPRTQAGTWTAK